jgi:hypothetical protein
MTDDVQRLPVTDVSSARSGKLQADVQADAIGAQGIPTRARGVSGSGGSVADGHRAANLVAHILNGEEPLPCWSNRY